MKLIYNEQLPPEFVNLLQMDQVLDNLHNKIIEDNGIDDVNETNESNSNEEKHTRRKRDADYITQTIDELHSVLLTLEKKYLNTTKGPVQCFVEPSGKVNCSTIVYENEAAWKQSRMQIDMLIKVLKDKIINLKDIKKHLKENRPINMTSDVDEEEFYGNFSTSIEDVSEESTSKATLPSHSHRHHQNGERKRKQKHSTTTTSTTEESLVTDDEIFSSSVTQESLIEEISSTIEAIKASTTIKPRNRTKNVLKTTTTTLSTTESGDYLTSEASFDQSTLADTLSTTESMKNPQIISNSVNHILNITQATVPTTTITASGENKTSQSAECLCAPGYEG
jgi:hypothetical protein